MAEKNAKKKLTAKQEALKNEIILVFFLGGLACLFDCLFVYSLRGSNS